MNQSQWRSADLVGRSDQSKKQHRYRYDLGSREMVGWRQQSIPARAGMMSTNHRHVYCELAVDRLLRLLDWASNGPDMDHARAFVACCGRESGLERMAAYRLGG